MELNRIILVPWDFTILAEYALQHAVKFAGKLKGEIILLHVVKKEEEEENLESELKKIATANTKTTGVKTEAILKIGTIFHDISKTAEELQAMMVIMGTHGIKGMQKYLGSWALKVIANTQIPFVVVQEPPKGELFKTLLYPINFRKENKEVVNWLLLFIKHFDIKIKIFAARYKDIKLKKSVSSNILFAQKIFEKKNIPYEIEWSAAKVDFAKATVEYAERVLPDVILVMTTRDISLADFLIGASEQYIIANSARIPVMCLSPRPITNVGGFMAGGG